MTTQLIDGYTCPCCGDPCKVLNEGYCHHCYEERQNELDQHNARFDWWEGLSDAGRRDQIRRAI